MRVAGFGRGGLRAAIRGTMGPEAHHRKTNTRRRGAAGGRGRIDRVSRPQRFASHHRGYQGKSSGCRERTRVHTLKAGGQLRAKPLGYHRARRPHLLIFSTLFSPLFSRPSRWCRHGGCGKGLPSHHRALKGGDRDGGCLFAHQVESRRWFNLRRNSLGLRAFSGIDRGRHAICPHQQLSRGAFVRRFAAPTGNAQGFFARMESGAPEGGLYNGGQAFSKRPRSSRSFRVPRIGVRNGSRNN